MIEANKLKRCLITAGIIAVCMTAHAEIEGSLDPNLNISY